MKFSKAKAIALGLLSALTLALPSVSQAQDSAAGFPSKPIHMVIQGGPGASADAAARLLADGLSKSMGQPWVVENRPGGGGSLAVELVANAEPDGYTLVLATSTSLAVIPALSEKPLDVVKALQPVSMVNDSDWALVVSPKIPVKTVAELVEYIKQKPGDVNFASTGVGTGPTMAAEMLRHRAGIDVEIIQFNGGAPATQSVLGGDTQALVSSIASALPYIKSGELIALASTGAKRSDLLPDVPTLDEAGYPGFEMSVWYALFAPGGTPKDIVDLIQVEVAKALSDPALQSAMLNLGLKAVSSTSDELAKLLSAESEKWTKVIEEIGIEPIK